MPASDDYPKLKLPDQGGSPKSFADLTGAKGLVVFVYAKDNTSGCSTEAGEFQAKLAAFQALGFNVAGVSKDSVKSHQGFAQKLGLGYPLLSDPGLELIKALGRLHYRTSYGQNVLVHTQEVAFLCGAMAADLGLDPRLGRRCGLLHDVGKAIDHEQEGSHPQLGYEALKRFGESETVANAALAHHEGHDPLTPYTVLAAAADAISAARPGARRANMEQYLKRLAQLEDIAVRFPGVQKAYAIQAGRELRVIVNQHTVPDAELAKMGRDITRAIADQVAFPGEVKVTLIRETRHVAVAR